MWSYIIGAFIFQSVINIGGSAYEMCTKIQDNIQSKATMWPPFELCVKNHAAVIATEEE